MLTNTIHGEKELFVGLFCLALSFCFVLRFSFCSVFVFIMKHAPGANFLYGKQKPTFNRS